LMSLSRSISEINWLLIFFYVTLSENIILLDLLRCQHQLASWTTSPRVFRSSCAYPRQRNQWRTLCYFQRNTLESLGCNQALEDILLDMIRKATSKSWMIHRITSSSVEIWSIPLNFKVHGLCPCSSSDLSVCQRVHRCSVTILSWARIATPWSQ
jgi:hypothetical protein